MSLYDAASREHDRRRVWENPRATVTHAKVDLDRWNAQDAEALYKAFRPVVASLPNGYDADGDARPMLGARGRIVAKASTFDGWLVEIDECPECPSIVGRVHLVHRRWMRLESTSLSRLMERCGHD